jgi:NADH-quinone oxidoreductase subunit G
VLLDRERCVLCQRCTRFSDQIAGDKFINLVERGAMQQIGIYEEQPFESYFSGNTVQICPVGALTGAAYRFRSRPFDLVSTPSTCEHCASGCAIRTDHRRGVVLRRMAIDDPEVNGEWNCDKGRWAFQSATLPDRLELPLLRQADGSMRAVGWPEALAAAAAGLAQGQGAAVLVGGRVSAEDAYAYGKFARVVLGHQRRRLPRPSALGGRDLLPGHPRRGDGVGADAGSGPGAVTYADLDAAKAVVLVGFEPEEESPIVFLRLRQWRAQGQDRRVCRGPLRLARPGEALRDPRARPSREPRRPPWPTRRLAAALRRGSGRASSSSVSAWPPRPARWPPRVLAASTGAKLAWIPRRAGERGALEAGALGALLPGGRPVTDCRRSR